jgi:hypothetical protein
MQFAIDFVKERTGREVPALWGALLQRAVAEPMPHGAAYVRQLLQSATGFVDPLGASVISQGSRFSGARVALTLRNSSRAARSADREASCGAGGGGHA